MATDFDNLVTDLERSYEELQTPHVRSGRLQRPPRGGGRRPPPEGARAAVQARAGVEGRAATTSLRRARTPTSASSSPSSRSARTALAGGAASRARPDRPRRPQGRDRRGAPGRRRRRGRALGGRRLPDARALRRAARLQGRGARGEPERRRRLQGGHVRGQGRRRVLRLQVGGRHAPRAARPRDRERRAASTPPPRRSR